jgi:hypothetical protein
MAVFKSPLILANSGGAGVVVEDMDRVHRNEDTLRRITGLIAIANS